MLAFNIEDDAIRLTAFKGKRITFVSEEPLTPGLVQDGVVIDREAVGQKIRKILLENRINDKEAVACVSATHSIYRVVFTPKIERALMAEAARREMEHVSPVPLDTLYTSWQDVAISNEEIGLCLLGLPHDNVDSVIDTMTIAGLNVKSLELKPLAVARVINESTAIVINIQQIGFDITIMQNGIPELIRSLTFPRADMAWKDQAEVIKEELERTVNFHNSSRADRQIDNNTACFISGTVQRSNMHDIGYAVKPLPNLITYPAWVDVDKFSANTGLIIKSIRAKQGSMKVDISAMPRIVSAAGAAAGKPVNTLLIALIIGVIIIIVVFIISSAAGSEVNRLKLTISQTQKLVADAQANIAQQHAQGASQLDQYRQTLTALKAPLDFLSKQREYISRDLGTILSTLPAAIYLTSVEDAGKSIKIEGLAPSSELILDYARDLRLSNNFGSVNVKSIENRKFSDYKFYFELSYKR